ncbi:Replication factor A protein 2 [Emydomyces testavorans]|uniref:Replication factor A protein 2 n=1 Tax=Emydomyces testavorans TaxID=2070801 RepID=A0AAF0IK13_9EURO|nr:Replication factor A protein 2 [Emydomyces testavorans]
MNYGYDNQYPSGSMGGGEGGGGFMAEASSSQGAKRYTKESLRPVTIKQINDASQPYPDAEFKIDGTEVTQVSFVGQVRNISQLTTFITYKLDDGTGEVEVKRWLDNADRPDGPPGDPMDTGEPTTGHGDKKEIVTNGYAKVWGKLSSFNNRRSVTAHVIRPLTNMDEYHYHFLEATAIHLFFTRGPPPSKDQTGADKRSAGQAANAAGDAGTRGRSLPHMSPTARRLYDTLSNTLQHREGLHAQQLASQMNMALSDVYKAGEELLSLGLIYQTVNDDTWALMDF